MRSIGIDGDNPRDLLCRLRPRTSFRITRDTFTVFLGRHRDVLEAIRRRRPEEARAAMESLLTGTRDFLEKRLGSPGGRGGRGKGNGTGRPAPSLSGQSNRRR